mgnify:CR=1 FL=1
MWQATISGMARMAFSNSLGPLVGMALDLDADENRETEPDAVAPQHGAIGLDIPFMLEPLHARADSGEGDRPTRSASSTLLSSAVRLERSDDAAIDRVESPCLACLLRRADKLSRILQIRAIRS